MRGSKPGERRGGRLKGTPNKKTAERVAAIEESGITPLDFMLKIMRDEACDEDAEPAQKIAFHSLRFEAAKAAAPYVHPRLAAIEHTGKDGSDLIPKDDPLEVARSIGFLLANATQA